MNSRLACFAFLVGGLLTLTASPALSLPTTTTTSLTVTGQGSTINFGNEVTLTATVQSDGSPVTPGTVNFCDASATYCTDIHLLGTAQLTSSGTAIYRYVPGPGTHSYKAVFIGTSANAANNYAPSTSPTESVTVYQYYYGQYATATAISASGSVGDYTLTALVGTNGSFLPNGTVSFLDTSNNNGLIDQATLGGNIGLSFLNVSNPATGSYPYSVAEGDFNGDGIEDLAVSGFYGDQITVLLGDGTGKFNPAAQINAPGNFESITVGDFNSDGKLDIAATNESNNTVSVLLGNGNGTFATALSPSTGSSPQSIAVADFNGDGILDLAVANGNDNTVTVLLGNGSGVFPKSATTATSSDPVFVAPGDFNGDGIEDLAVANYASGTISILLGKGDGTFTTAPSLAVGSPRSIAVADFNRDGKPDLAATSYYGDTVTVFLGTGGGNFSTNITIGTGSQPGAVATGDFNQDGLADLAVANYDSGSVTILLGNGSGSFSAGGSPVAGNSPYALVIGDFNNDGVPDLAVTQGDGNTVATLLTESLTASASINGISLPVATGTHSVEASYPGDTYHYASTSITIPLAAAKGNPVATLSASTTSPSYGSSVTLSVTVTGTGLPPSGTVNFADSGAVLGSATVNGSGVANYTTSSLPQGSNSIQAQYTGDGNYNAAYSNTVTVTVGAAQSQTITFPSIGPQTVGANISLNATASSGLPVSFVSEASSICTVSGSTATMIAAGTCTIQATQPGNSTYSPAPPVSQSFSVSLPVATPPVFSPAGGTYSSAQSVFLSDSSGAPIYYTINGGTPTTSSTPYSGPITVSSSETIRAIAGGSGYANSSVSTASYTINLPGATTTSITTSVNPATLGQTVTFSVTVRPTSGNGIPSGAVTLLIDGVSQGALQLNGAGSVQYSISSLQVGSHTIAASYGGSSSFSTSGGSLTEVVEAFAPRPPSLQVQALTRQYS